MDNNHEIEDLKPIHREPWNKGKLIGAKPPLRPSHVWSIRTKLQMANRKRDLALFNLAIDSKLRGCDVVTLRVDDVAPSDYAMDCATIRQKKTGRPVRFELTEQTRSAVDDYLRLTGRKPGQLLFAGRGEGSRGLTTRQYARLVHEWVASIGLDPAKFGTHSLRRTKAVLIYRRTGNLRAVQILLGHSKIESTCAILGLRSTMRSRSLRRSTSDDSSTPMSTRGRRVYGGADYGRGDFRLWDRPATDPVRWLNVAVVRKAPYRCWRSGPDADVVAQVSHCNGSDRRTERYG